MNKFIIVDGLPFLLAHGKAYAVRLNEVGFTVGAEVELASVPAVTYSEISIRAKCAGRLDSITVYAPEPQQETDGQKEPEPQQEQPDFDGMTVPELKEYAEAHGIDLGAAKKKAEIIEAIKGVIE